jgi:hypothetical protein
MPMTRKGAGSALFDRAMETVLADRPCRVIIVAPPQTAPRPPELAAA